MGQIAALVAFVFCFLIIFGKPKARKKDIMLPNPSAYRNMSDIDSSPPRPQQRLQFPPGGTHHQEQSLFFSMLPAEIRGMIYSYALSPCENTEQCYDADTCYKRPGYEAPLRVHMEILRTCSRVYQEAWHVSWANSEHVFYLTNQERKPRNNTTSVERAQDTLNYLSSSGVKLDVNHVRIFPQLCQLEKGTELQRILDMHHFRPRGITITIRHTDWWYWEIDQPMRIAASWVNTCRFPDSLRYLSIDFETVERRANQVDHLAEQACADWRFRRHDGVPLVARNADLEVTRWSGSSVWGLRRWLRDETRAGQLDYYVKTITWRPKRDALADQEIEAPDLAQPPDRTPLPQSAFDSVSMVELKGLAMDRHTPADEIRLRLPLWRQQRQRTIYPPHPPGSLQMRQQLFTR